MTAIVAVMFSAGALMLGPAVSARTIQIPTRATVQAQHAAHAVTVGHKKKHKKKKHKKAKATTASPASKVVTFAVTGTAPAGEFDTLTINYGSDTISDAGGTSTPWSATLPYINPKSDSSLYYDLDASLSDAGGSITCSITIQGKSYTSTANGPEESCDEEVSYFLGSWSAS
ncbi:MAG: hypothetical protein WAO09_07555 [Candidatus Dormiibacterota bacterium]